MTALHRHAHGGGRNGYRIVTQDFAGFVHHLHLFLGVTVRQEGVDVRKHVQVNGMGKFGTAATGTFGLQLLDTALTGTRYALVSAHHNAFDAVGLVQGSDGQHHLDGGAVGVGDDVVLGGKDIGVDLRDNQRHVLVHAPERGIVHHKASHGCELRGQFTGCGTTGAEQRQGRLLGDGFIGTDHRPFLSLEAHFLAPGTGRCHRQQLRHREIPFFQYF